MSFLIYELTNPALPHSSSYHLQHRRSLPPYPIYTELAARFYHRLALKELAKHKRDTMKSLSLSSLTLSLLLMMMLLNTKSCGASILLPEMDGDVPLYSIADSNLDLEFMVDSEINRILTGARVGTTGGTQNPYAALYGCGRGKRYCVPKGRFCCYPIFDPCFDKFSEKSKNNKKH